MRYALSDEQQMFRDSLRGWVKQEASSDLVREWADTADEDTFESLLAEAGWAGVGFPEQAGGQGGGLVETVLAAEEFGRAAAPTSGWLATAVALGSLVDAGLDLSTAPFALVVDWSRPFSPPEAIEVSSAGRLTGEVRTVVGATRARTLLVPAGPERELGLWLVDADAAGVQVTPRRTLDRSRRLANVRFHDVGATRLETDVLSVLARARDRMAVVVAGGTVGAADRMLDMAVEYSLQREQFGRPIGSFQAVKHAAASMLVAIEPVRSIVRYAAWTCEVDDPEAPLHAAVAKAQSSKMGIEAAETALTMHGAIGFTWEHDLQLFYKRVKLDHALGGPPSVWNERVAHALDLGDTASLQAQPA